MILIALFLFLLPPITDARFIISTTGITISFPTTINSTTSTATTATSIPVIPSSLPQRQPPKNALVARIPASRRFRWHPTIIIDEPFHFDPPPNISIPATTQPPLAPTQLQKRNCIPDCDVATETLCFVDSMADFQKALFLQLPSELEWHVNGCQHSLTDKPAGFDFSHACERHNFGVRNYHPGGRWDSRIRKKVDAQLWEDMENVCKGIEDVERNKKCLFVAQAYLLVMKQDTLEMAELEVDAEGKKEGPVVKKVYMDYPRWFKELMDWAHDENERKKPNVPW